MMRMRRRRSQEGRLRIVLRMSPFVLIPPQLNSLKDMSTNLNFHSQRAFRERKERHVKELEAQVAALESARTAAATENETLKASLHRAKTENEILKATTAPISHAYSSSISHTGPMGYTPRDQSSFYSNVLKGHDNKEPSHRIVKDETGGRLLAAAAAWDFIMEDERVKEGRVDVVRVSEYLRNRARCDGMGPVFAEGEILAAIEECTGMDSDTL